MLKNQISFAKIYGIIGIGIIGWILFFSLSVGAEENGGAQIGRASCRERV